MIKAKQTVAQVVNRKKVVEERIGYDRDTHDISNFAANVFLRGKDCSFFDSWNGRFTHDFIQEIKGSESEGDLRCAGNVTRIESLLARGEDPKKKQFISIDHALTSELHKFLDKLKSWSNNVEYGKCEDDIDTLKLMFPLIVDKHLVIDGNTFWALVHECHRLTTDDSLAKMKSVISDKKVKQMALYYTTKPVPGVEYNMTLLENLEDDYIKDLRLLQVVIQVVANNATSWTISKRRNYMEKMIRLMHVILFHYHSDEPNFAFSSYAKELYAMKASFLPNDKDFNKDFKMDVNYDQIMLTALFTNDAMIEKFGEEASIVNASLITFKPLLNTIVNNFRGVNPINFKEGLEYLNLLYEKIVEFQYSSKDIRSDRERITRLSVACKDSPKVKKEKERTINALIEKKGCVICSQYFDKYIDAAKNCLVHYFTKQHLAELNKVTQLSGIVDKMLTNENGGKDKKQISSMAKYIQTSKSSAAKALRKELGLSC